MSEDIYRDRIKEAIKFRSITQSELAGLSGFTQSKISRLLDGHSNLTLDNTLVLCNAIGLEISDLVGDSESFYRALGMEPKAAAAIQQAERYAAKALKAYEQIVDIVEDLRIVMRELSIGSHRISPGERAFVADRLGFDSDADWSQAGRADIKVLRDLSWKRNRVISDSCRQLKKLQGGAEQERLSELLAQCQECEDSAGLYCRQGKSYVAQILLRSGFIGTQKYEQMLGHDGVVAQSREEFHERIVLPMQEHFTSLGYDCVPSMGGMKIRFPGNVISIGIGGIDILDADEPDWTLWWGSFDFPESHFDKDGDPVDEDTVEDLDSIARKRLNQTIESSKAVYKKEKLEIQKRLEDLGYEDLDEYMESEHWEAICRMWLGANDYADYLDEDEDLDTLEWDQISDIVWCESCGCEDARLYHWSFAHLGDEEGHLDDLVPLCTEHHKEIIALKKKGQDIRLTEAGRKKFISRAKELDESQVKDSKD